jgi:hypothetical protein
MTGVTNEEGTAYPSKASVLVGFVLFISSNEMLPVFSSVLWYVQFVYVYIRNYHQNRQFETNYLNC